MKGYRTDLHVHLGRAGGKAVKIPASPDLTLASILETCAHQKGIDIVGVVDAVTDGARRELREMVNRGDLEEVPGGGLTYRGLVTLFLGAEIEVRTGYGPSHWVALFPSLVRLDEFAAQWASSVHNTSLSTQQSSWSADQLGETVRQLAGIFFPAHAFTPHKGVLGAAADRLQEVLSASLLSWMPAVELGLSADTAMADRVAELGGKTFLSHSDAHSTAKLGREFNVFRLSAPTFAEVMLALEGQHRRCLESNYGLNPRLGKYHRTFCHNCDRTVLDNPPVTICPVCQGTNITLGVADRLEQIADRAPCQASTPGLVSVPGRPPYHYQIPLEFIPGVGRSMINRLVQACGSELTALHDSSEEELASLTGTKLAARIIAARSGQLAILPGGGGRYGKIML